MVDMRNSYHRLVKMLEKFSGEELTLQQITSLIYMNIGSNDRTIEQAIKIMGNTGLIKDLGDCKFKIK